MPIVVAEPFNRNIGRGIRRLFQIGRRTATRARRPLNSLCRRAVGGANFFNLPLRRARLRNRSVPGGLDHAQLRARLQQQRGVGRERMAHLERAAERIQNVNRRPNLRAQANRQQPLNRGNLNPSAQRGQYVPGRNVNRQRPVVNRDPRLARGKPRRRIVERQRPVVPRKSPPCIMHRSPEEEQGLFNTFEYLNIRNNDY